MIARLLRAFRPLDTAAVDTAIEQAARSQTDVMIRARARRMDISCGDPAAAIEAMTATVVQRAGHVLRRLYPPPPPAPRSIASLMDELDRL